MATISASTFRAEIRDFGYVSLTDRGDNRALRSWTVETREVFAVIHRPGLAQTVPRKIAFALIAAAIRDGLIPVTFDTPETEP